ncbi:MAG TPA: LysR family transcriptional regulator [Acidimicrobiales bacterium]|jgi:DNA-binding transcriptional LysR family regulator
MDLRQLEQFVAVAEEGNFTRAAQRCQIAQSALSTSIRALERDLGAALFIRTTRRVELSATGHALLPEATRVLAAAASARDAVNQSVGRVRGSIAVGLVWGSIGPLLRAYRQAFPDVEITLRQGLSVALVDDVVRGALDLAFVGLPPDGWPAGIRVVSVRSEPVGIACAVGHRLARLEKVGIRQLAGEVFVANPGDVASRNAVHSFFGQSGVEYRTVFTVEDVPSMLDLVAHGLAISLLPKAAAESKPGIAYVPLDGFTPMCDAAVVTADRPASAATRTFLDTVEAMAFQL